MLGGLSYPFSRRHFSMKIAVIGAGHVGRALARLLKTAGHNVHFGVRAAHVDADLRGTVSSVAEAAAFGELVLCAVPYGAWPQLALELAPLVKGKIVIDATNPYPERDGEFARTAIDAAEGAGAPVAKLLPGARLVRAFNSVPWPGTASEVGRRGARVAIPLAGDDAKARGRVAGLIRDAGFDPVDVGPLENARAFDPDGPGYGKALDAVALREALATSAPEVKT
jgi:8-hydroxy-5-deazaflavin:NADPH oxidoreductase